MFGRMPMLTSTRSVSSDTAPSGVSTETVAPSALRSMAVTFEPVSTSMPCFLSERVSAAEISASSFGRMRDSISTTVTWAP